MKTAAAGAAPQAPAPLRTCRPVCFRALPGISKNKLSCVPLLREIPRETLLAEFHDAPQFAKIRLRPLLEDTRGAMRVLLLAESGYYAAQAAMYLASLSRTREGLSARRDSDDFWGDVDLSELEGPENPEAPSALLRRSLAVISPAMLDPSLRQERTKKVAVLREGEGEASFNLCSPELTAALIAAPAGRVLTSRVIEQVETAGQREEQGPLDLFIALQPGQVDLELLEELRFTYGFQVARVDQPDQDYLRRFLQNCAESLLAPIDKLADLDQVIAHTRRCRGKSFCEADLESLVLWAIQRRAQVPLKAKDLLFTPFKSGQEGWKALKRMTGLEEVKETLRRLLASAILEDRRRQAGKPVRPFCRNLAFAGPPGTGKSVTARLAAQILREEGCGTGRFVEAGREQLIGTFLGETSPKIAELFEQARGGVLFIDEAGALLDGGQDIYAAEAVNALVRHMELEPETMVILATYSGEMKRLLASNPGLKSRVAQVLEFPAYDNGQLWEIFQGFAKEEGYALPQGAETVCRDFLSALRRQDPEGFGNGREVRRLFQGAVEELALRALDMGAETLTLQDLEAAAKRLQTQPGAPERIIGF